MFKSSKGKYAGRYTVPADMYYTDRLSFVWKVSNWFILVASILAGIVGAIAWKKYGEGVINDRNLEKIVGLGVFDVASNFTIISFIVFLLCAACYSILRMGLDLKLTWPSIMIGALSCVVGAVGFRILVSTVLSYRDFLTSLSSVNEFKSHYGVVANKRNLEDLYNLFQMSTNFIMVVIFILILIFLSMAIFGFFAILEVFKREPLIAKTTGDLKISTYDNMRVTKQRMMKMVETSLKAEKLKEDRIEEELALVSSEIENNRTLMLEENGMLVGFLVRTQDYNELLEVWVLKSKRRKGFGGYLVRDYIDHAMKSKAEGPLVADMPGDVPSLGKLLVDCGWSKKSGTIGTRNYYTYDIEDARWQKEIAERKKLEKESNKKAKKASKKPVEPPRGEEKDKG